MSVFLEMYIWILFFCWPNLQSQGYLMGFYGMIDVTKARRENKSLYFSSRKTPREVWILDPVQPSSQQVTLEPLYLLGQ